jgi:signal transduction protein with GAF and PtsI domain
MRRFNHFQAIIMAQVDAGFRAESAFEVPMIIGLEGVFEAVREREFLIVDGNSGLLFRNPPHVIKEEYRRLRIEKEKLNQQLGALRDQKAITFCSFP